MWRWWEGFCSPLVTVQNTICGSAHYCSPDNGLIINIRLVASCWFLSLHPKFMMHSHKSLKNDYLVSVAHIYFHTDCTTPTDIITCTWQLCYRINTCEVSTTVLQMAARCFHINKRTTRHVKQSYILLTLRCLLLLTGCTVQCPKCWRFPIGTGPLQYSSCTF